MAVRQPPLHPGGSPDLRAGHLAERERLGRRQRGGAGGEWNQRRTGWVGEMCGVRGGGGFLVGVGVGGRGSIVTKMWLL